ncbi:MAG: hypothetical protein H0Z32_01145 [Bacillaceae bacterium]|nr:hypothetical protein [Bacillaceae bacterium]
MKRYFITFALLVLLFGCSNKAEEPKATESLSLEQQITRIMSENRLSSEEIIDYDIKDDFIYAIFKNRHEYGNGHNPDLVILKIDDGSLAWVAGPDDRTMSISFKEGYAMIFGREEGPSVTIFLPDEKIKEIKVMGESAKAITYTDYLTDNFSKPFMYWIAFTDKEPSADDFEFILQSVDVE